jgi:hypothetical protein
MERLSGRCAMQKDLYTKLGELTAAWSTLDYVLRLAIKRLEGISMNAPQSPAEKQRIDVIFGGLNHTQLIAELKKALAAKPVAGLDALIDQIGASRSGPGLYARRNTIVHALWAVTSDGKAFQQRIGAKDWRQAMRIKNSDIEVLIGDIRKTMEEIDRLTRR